MFRSLNRSGAVMTGLWVILTLLEYKQQIEHSLGDFFFCSWISNAK